MYISVKSLSRYLLKIIANVKLRKYLLIVYMLGIHYPNFGRNLSIYVLYKNLIFFLRDTIQLFVLRQIKTISVFRIMDEIQIKTQIN